MIEQYAGEKQCSRCLMCKSTLDFKFRSMTMTYYETCRACDAEVKAAKQQPKPAPPPKPERKCKACHTWKLLTLFPKDPTCTGGHAYKCRDCKNEASRIQREALRAANKKPTPKPETAIPDCPTIRSAWMTTRVPAYARPSVLGAVVGLAYG